MATKNLLKRTLPEETAFSENCTQEEQGFTCSRVEIADPFSMKNRLKPGLHTRKKKAIKPNDRLVLVR
jgi:hypothetical protein